VAHQATVEATAPDAVDWSSILDRVLVFDDFFPSTQIMLLEKWALQTPHWMLTNSSHDEQGHARHRIWGASYIDAYRKGGWPGLPPVLFTALATAFQKLGLIITAPEYLGLNGQSRGMNGGVHIDCAPDAPDQLSLLIYLGEDTDGDLVLYDKKDRQQEVQRISFRPNRVVVMDGSIPHAAQAPSDDRFRMSVIARGTYQRRQAPAGRS
jgi:hypothetical protein